MGSSFCREVSLTLAGKRHYEIRYGTEVWDGMGMDRILLTGMVPGPVLSRGF